MNIIDILKQEYNWNFFKGIVEPGLEQTLYVYCSETMFNEIQTQIREMFEKSSQILIFSEPLKKRSGFHKTYYAKLGSI